MKAKFVDIPILLSFVIFYIGLLADYMDNATRLNTLPLKAKSFG